MADKDPPTKDGGRGSDPEEADEVPSSSGRGKLKGLAFGKKKAPRKECPKKKRSVAGWGFQLCTKSNSCTDLASAKEEEVMAEEEAPPEPVPYARSGLPSKVHTQIDYIHCLVPELERITACGFYWGKMDRYEAERLLEGRAEGSFLLRDSAQEEHLFSVSFRRFDRSLHARIEQWHHRFSFDSHDPSVFSSPSVVGLIAHYKSPLNCSYFDPAMFHPVNRNFPFSLQYLARAALASRLSYDAVSELALPRSLKSYLKEYHYKQQVRVRRLDGE